MIRWAIFVSGEGTNLQNVLELERDHLKTQEVALVLANRACRGLSRAELFKKPAYALPLSNSQFNELSTNKSSSNILPSNNFESQALDLLRDYRIDKVMLLGFMKILSKPFIEAFEGELINLHPSLLPRHRGLDAVKKAFDAGDTHLGISLHRVVPEVDAGEILLQKSVVRASHWTFDDALAAVHQIEYQGVREFLLSRENRLL